MTDPKPGESMVDPACGSGRMLLAALEVCRERHGGDPRLYGVDLDAYAVRACRMNLALTGLGAMGAERRESVTIDTSAIALASTEAGQLLLDLALPSGQDIGTPKPSRPKRRLRR